MSVENFTAVVRLTKTGHFHDFFLLHVELQHSVVESIIKRLLRVLFQRLNGGEVAVSVLVAHEILIDDREFTLDSISQPFP